MKFKRRRKIITETGRKISFAIRRQSVRFFCAACNSQSEMLSINEAAKKSETGWREIVGWIESGRLHSAETEAGEIYVCAASLAGENKFKQKGEIL